MSTIRDNTTTMTVYNYIYQEILNQRFKPGQPLTESSLSKLLNVGRSPVRQALQKLAIDGFVVLHENRGAFVERFSKTEIYQLYSLRGCFIDHALEQSLNLYDETDFEYMRDCITRQERAFEDLDFQKYTIALRDFYSHIIDKPGNEYLSELANSVLNRINVYTCIYDNFFSVKKLKSLPLQEKIVDAIAAGKPKDVKKVHQKLTDDVVGFYDYTVKKRGL